MPIKSHRGKLVVDFRDPATGERVRVRVPESEQAGRRAAAFERKVAAGWRPTAAAPKVAKSPTLEEFWPRFLEFQGSPANKRPNRPRTLLELQRVYDLYLGPYMGHTPITAIDTTLVDGFAANLARRKLSRSTIGNVLGALRRALNVAKRWGLIDTVPEIDAAKPKSQNAIEPEHWLTREEAAALIQNCGSFAPLALFAIRTGLRMGELQALRWGDVLLGQHGRVHVRRAWSEATQTFGPTKSGRTRELPLAEDATRELERIHNARWPSADELVFPSEGGRPLNPTSFAKALRRAAKRAGLNKHVHAHMLRHTYASHCIAAGIPTRVVMAWGGWESEAMLARYAHLAPREIEHWAAMLPGT